MNPFDILKNAGQIKQQGEKLQQELAQITAEGSSGGRMVTITLNGKFEMKGIKLDPICVDNRDVGMLEDLIVAAHKNAMDNIQEQIKERTSSLLGGLDLGALGL
ncbi:DNA-binding protein, YbaB/EbfC family [Treponema sp. JC4]|uniref:YbaB/EbfC family nucleoid-associated protein n=1 Tax=unclassified Treponema TaxID=2638727 RepID=UPI00025AFB1A|nr:MULTISPECIES: YbaB/EbfC family nucleoid-associated protein [unclassified Treponema]EID86077.1 DNA-binding protein, YbaB/EbfC family [Treponema sp. JC4]